MVESQSRPLFLKEADTMENGVKLLDRVRETGYVDHYSEPIVFRGELLDGSSLGTGY